MNGCTSVYVLEEHALAESPGVVCRGDHGPGEPHRAGNITWTDDEAIGFVEPMDDPRVLYADPPAVSEPSEEQILFARGALAIRAGVEALGPTWRCWVDVWNNAPKTAKVNVRVGGLAAEWRLVEIGCQPEALDGLLITIAHEGGAAPEEIDAGRSALRHAFAHWSPEYVRSLFPPRDLRPLPLPG